MVVRVCFFVRTQKASIIPTLHAKIKISKRHPCGKGDTDVEVKGIVSRYEIMLRNLGVRGLPHF